MTFTPSLSSMMMTERTMACDCADDGSADGVSRAAALLAVPLAVLAWVGLVGRALA